MDRHLGLKGIWPVLVTPYNHDLTIDFAAYREILDWHLSFDLGGLYANCLSSEMFELSNKERSALIYETVKASNGKVPVAVTVNFGESLKDHIAFCNRATDLGADIMMLTIPTFVKNDDDLERYLFTIAEQTELPLGLYECPAPRHYLMGLNLIEKLANSGKFFAYKETSCDMDKILSIIELTKNTSLSYLQANIPFMVASIQAGCPGSMNVVANWLPDLTIEVAQKAAANDPSVIELNSILCLLEMAQRSIHPTGVKYLMSKRGLPISPRTRYKKKLTKEEAKSLDTIADSCFDKNGALNGLAHLVGVR